MTNANGVEEGPLPSTLARDEEHLDWQRPPARISNATKTDGNGFWGSRAHAHAGKDSGD
ncbi:hypothetical protein [Nesterenkonia sp. CF4.4]|uniref:hypothetical protein n=1 Tax=Nesterenkonia sp. CF4.4 TaxID=3373079 RepID=UPI003EE70E95